MCTFPFLKLSKGHAQQKAFSLFDHSSILR